MDAPLALDGNDGIESAAVSKSLFFRVQRAAGSNSNGAILVECVFQCLSHTMPRKPILSEVHGCASYDKKTCDELLVAALFCTLAVSLLQAFIIKRTTLCGKEYKWREIPQFLSQTNVLVERGFHVCRIKGWQNQFFSRCVSSDKKCSENTRQ